MSHHKDSAFIRSAALRLSAAAALCLGAGVAWAQVAIHPTVVELTPRQRIAAVSIVLSASAPRPMRLQAELLRWTQDADGEQITAASDDLIVTPAIAELRPGERQIFRIAARSHAPRASELAYRLVLEDVGSVPTFDPSSGTAINFRMRYDLPVLIEQTGPVRNDLRWMPCQRPAPTSVQQDDCVRVVNAGNRRMKIQSLRLHGAGWQQELPLKEAQIVLAGAEREWRVPRGSAERRLIDGIAAITGMGETVHATRAGNLQTSSAAATVR